MHAETHNAYPHTLLVYVDHVHRTRIEVVEMGENALEATCVHLGTMRASSARSLVRSVLRAALRIQGITWSHDNDGDDFDPRRTFTYAFRLGDPEVPAPRTRKSVQPRHPRKRNV